MGVVGAVARGAQLRRCGVNVGKVRQPQFPPRARGTRNGNTCDAEATPVGFEAHILGLF